MDEKRQAEGRELSALRLGLSQAQADLEIAVKHAENDVERSSLQEAVEDCRSAQKRAERFRKQAQAL